ncbi:MAG TPA: hypothetical protein VE242_01970 [Chthoniobacterales bacterium]|nr:hypothetical protein [Chthoniobacterales bacterium]
MPPKFGNYLFRNLKGQNDPNTPGSPALENAAELANQTILLRPEDFIDGACESAVLNWPSLEPPEIRVQFKDTQGLMQGRVTIAAGVLRDSYPTLVPPAIKDDVLFYVSLKTVVLQLQNYLRAENVQSATAPPADFDTPIAQVAREDEGFFKLERAAQNNPPRIENPNQAQFAGDMSSFPLIREKPQSAPPNPPAIQVSWSPTATPGRPPTETRPDPFKDLPKVGPDRENRKPGLEPRHGEAQSENLPARPIRPRADLEAVIPVSDKPLRRLGLERLQEIFLTDDFLDAGQVAKLLRAFPKVKGALILLENGTVMGGDLPQGFELEAAFAAPGLLRASREFAKTLNGSDIAAVTLLADVPISVFLERKVCILIAHEGRGLLPGMRERVSDIAKALDAMYEPREA